MAFKTGLFDRMSAVVDASLDSLSSLPVESSEMSGTFPAVYAGSSYGYSGSGVDHQDHYSDGLGESGQSDRYEVDYQVDNYASASGNSGHSGGAECCPLVVDLLCLAAIIGSIGGAAVLLSRVIQIEITPPGKRSLPFLTFVFEGKLAFATLCPQLHICCC